MRHLSSSVAMLSLCVMATSLASRTAVAQPTGDSSSILPSDPSLWVNSLPITDEMLKGKAAFLWFYEET